MAEGDTWMFVIQCLQFYRQALFVELGGLVIKARVQEAASNVIIAFANHEITVIQGFQNGQRPLIVLDGLEVLLALEVA